MPIIVYTAICSCIFIHLLPTHIRSLFNILTQETRRKCLRWMDVLGNKFTWKTQRRVFVSCVAARSRQANMASLWLPCHGLQGWNMFLITVKLPAANSIMWLFFSRCLSYSFFVSLRNTLRIPLFFLSPYTVKKFSCWRRTKHPCWRKKVNFPSNRQFGPPPSALADGIPDGKHYFFTVYPNFFFSLCFFPNILSNIYHIWNRFFPDLTRSHFSQANFCLIYRTWVRYIVPLLHT